MKFVDVKNDIAFRRLREAYKDADKHSWNKEELIAYDNASIAEQDIIGKRIAAEKKGMVKGKIEAKEQVIEKCIEENMSIAIISKIVALPVNEVTIIIEQIKKRG